MRFIGSITEEDVLKYVEEIHQEEPASTGHITNRLSEQPKDRSWLLAYLDLSGEIGTIINRHHHLDQKTGKMLELSNENETWNEATKSFEERTKDSSWHECLERLSNITKKLSEDENFLIDRPLLIELVSLKPLKLKHIDGFHRVFAYLRMELNQEILCYVVSPLNSTEALKSYGLGLDAHP